MSKSMNTSRLPERLRKRVAGEFVDGLFRSNDFSSQSEIFVSGEEGDSLKSRENDCNSESASNCADDENVNGP